MLHTLHFTRTTIFIVCSTYDHTHFLKAGDAGDWSPPISLNFWLNLKPPKLHLYDFRTCTYETFKNNEKKITFPNGMITK